jgi:DNA invertase Pin-like site-specific DNA recombinase
MSTQRRAIGIIRVSQDAGEKDSPASQRRIIEETCEREGLHLLHCEEESNVSGGTPLVKRHGLRRAIEAVEEGRADVIVAAYYDRLYRSADVQSELIRRVEAAGGGIFATDIGVIADATAGQWLSNRMLGLVAEHHRRITKEKSATAQQRAIDRGVAPYPAPPGYRREQHQSLTLSEDADAMREAFELRADGASITQVRDLLIAHGIKRSPKGVENLLGSKTYLGQIHFGKYTPNLAAHPAIVDEATWHRAQRAKNTGGRVSKSERLLARMRLLRCSGCGGGMVTSSQTQQGKMYPSYRCGNPDCTNRMVISATVAESVVVEHVARAIADEEGRASMADNAQLAEAVVERAQKTLDGLIAILDPTEPASIQRLREATRARDEARERLERLSGGNVIVRGWRDDYSLDAKRALIRAVVERVDILPGRGAERVKVTLVQ